METAAIYGLSTSLGHNAIISQMPLLPIVLELFSLIHIKLWTNWIAYTLDRLKKISIYLIILFVVLKKFSIKF
jgi:hypothetical protein